MDIDVRQLRSPVERHELDQERHAFDHTTQLFDEIDGRSCGAAGCEQIVNHEHALAFLIELVALNGREKLRGYTLHTVLKY